MFGSMSSILTPCSMWCKTMCDVRHARMRPRPPTHAAPSGSICRLSSQPFVVSARGIDSCTEDVEDFALVVLLANRDRRRSLDSVSSVLYPPVLLLSGLFSLAGQLLRTLDALPMTR